MQVKEVDPYKVNVDEMNERKENLNITDLEESVKEQGVIQPPIVRERNGDAEVPYSVVVGQRRTLAAQSAGLDSIPVVVMDWGDSEALEASVTENVEAFNEAVSRKDRAYAIERLKSMNGWSNSDVAKHLGVVDEDGKPNRQTIKNWLEYTHPDWEGTVVHPETSDGGGMTDDGHISQSIDDVSPDIVQYIRTATGGGEEGEELLAKAVEHDLNKDDVRELSKKVKRGQDTDSALAQTIEEKHNTGGIKVMVPLRVGEKRKRTNDLPGWKWRNGRYDTARSRGIVVQPARE